MFGPIKSKDHGKKKLKGVEVSIVELTWKDGTTSFEVHGEDTDYTESGCFSTYPTDEQIQALISLHEDSMVDEMMAEVSENTRAKTLN